MSSVIMNCGGQAAGPVKGMPFSAQEITEKRLILPNGSIAKESVTALITRDAEGRTRRELPPTLAPGQPPRPGLTMIADPIAGYLYLLHPDKTALRSKLPTRPLRPQSRRHLIRPSPRLRRHRPSNSASA
jgi:hypothetical protein